MTYPEECMEPNAELRGDMFRYTKVSADFTQRSIAISLKRIADMMEEDRKPQLSIAPEGWVGDDERRRLMREGLARGNELLDRIASAIEAQRAETTKIGSVEDEGATRKGTPK